MQIRNTRQTYGLIAILLHWMIALGFLIAYVSVYYMRWYTKADTSENLTALQIHISIGVSVGAFVVLSIIWKAINATPEDVPGTCLEHIAAHIVRLGLYAIMIIMPITGYLGMKRPPMLLFSLQIPNFEETAIFETIVAGWMGLTFNEFERVVDLIHHLGGRWIFWWPIALHAGAAVYHHVIRKDIALKRMLSPSAKTWPHSL